MIAILTLLWLADALQLPAPDLRNRVGMGEPEMIAGADAWQAPLLDGGFARLTVYPDAEAAHRAFAFGRVSAATAPPADLILPGLDEAAGDGTGFVLGRLGAQVVLVRSDAGRASEVARAMLLPQVPDHPTP